MSTTAPEKPSPAGHEQQNKDDDNSPRTLSSDPEAIQHNALSTKPTPPPDGGARAWLVALGAFCAMFCTFGYLNSFGVFQSYYAQRMLHDRSPSDIAWIGSLQIFLLFLGGLVSGPLADRFGIRAVLIPASLVLVLAIMMTSLASQYYQLILAHGILQGIGNGLIFTPALSTVGQYFTTKRAWAMGVVVSGASVGGVVFPIALNRMLNASDLGFGWSLRVVGFLVLVLLAFACMVMKEHAPRRRHKFFLPEAFRSGPYVFSVLAFFLTLFGIWTPIFYIVDYATFRNVNSQLAFYEVAVLNAASFFGRTLPGFAGDKLGRFNANIVVTLGSAILIFCWTLAQSSAAVTVLIALYGFFGGAVVSLYSPVIAQICPQPSNIGTYIGMGLAFCSLGGLAGTPINGALIVRYGFLSTSMFSAVLVLAGAASSLIARLLLSKKVLKVV